jgi:hypothetical protein
MNKTTILAALAALKKADVIKIKGVSACYPITVSFADLNGEPENEIVYFNWGTPDGHEFSITLTEKGLNNAKSFCNKLECEDHEGGPTVLFLYVLRPLHF